MSGDIDTLVEMGWDRSRAELALNETKHRGVEAAIDWLFSHPTDQLCPSTCETSRSPATTIEAVVRSFVCEDCGKHLRTDDDIQSHGARTGHFNFRESTEEIKPLTEEEKQAQLQRLREAMEQRKLQREEEERKKQLEDEKIRRLQGKTLVSAKQHFKEEMMKREAEQIKRQRAEDMAYRAKLREEIARDKAERIAKRNGEMVAKIIAAEAKPKLSSNPSAACQIQIRLPSGSPIKNTFRPSDPLSEVLKFVSQSWSERMHGAQINPNDVTLQTTFPIRKYGDGDISKTLAELDLCPSAVLIARRIQDL